ncbi:MAG: SMP-30/gluconolactonase/LRE family protein [candidate division Zixibacteria bacterium]|nr:SMP-30/gluconolactonase/LRE family protein [candidate division Zixibacteria bacterium]
MNLIDRFRGLAAGRMITLAGVGQRHGIPAKEADAGWPMGVTRNPGGDLIVVDYQWNRIWRIDRDGILHPFAGDGIPGNSGDGGPASEARFYWPHDLTQDRHGNLYLSDLGNYTIRRIDGKTGVVTRVAGSGALGRGGDGGPAIDAELDCTCGVAVDAGGHLFLASEWMNNIRRVDARTGIIETVFGQIARHYPSEHGNSRPFAGPGLALGGYHGDGGPARDAGFFHPEHLAFDSAGALYVCDNSNDRIRKIDMKTGIVTTILGTGQRASNGDGGPAVEASVLMPDAICVDAHDNLYVGEKYGFRIRKVDRRTGIVRTLVGTGVPGFGEEGLHGSITRCNSVESGICADPDGTVFWGDCSGRLRRYDGTTGIVTTVLGGTSVHDGETADRAFLNGPGGLSVGPDGHIYITDAWAQRVRAIDPATGVIRAVAGTGARAYGGDNGPAIEAHLGNPQDISVDAEGRVVIADHRHGHVRRVDRDGIIRNLAGAAFQWDKGDGGPAIQACLVNPASVAHAPDGSVFVGDAVGRIRKINAQTGIITTVAGVGRSGLTGDGGPATKAKIGNPVALCFDRHGHLYVADAVYHVIRRVDAESGTITTVAGCGVAGFSPDGTRATDARICAPWGVAVDHAGGVYFSDSKNNRVRRITENGALETVVGNGVPGDAGDEGAATEMRLNEPHSLCFYGDDLLLVGDHLNNKIRAVKLKCKG